MTAISTSPKKREAALEMGADHFVVSKDADSMAAAAKSLDLLIDTVSADHDVMAYVPLVDTNGVVVMIGAALKPMVVSLDWFVAFPL